MNLLLVGEISKHLLMPIVQKGTNVLERQALVLRDGDVSDILGLDAYSKRELVMQH